MNDGNLIAVRVIGVPVDIWQRASSHQEAIQREFEIISAGQPAHSVPNRLQKLIEEFDGRFGEGDELNELQAAGHQGVTKKDLCFRVPQLAAVAARRFGYAQSPPPGRGHNEADRSPQAATVAELERPQRTSSTRGPTRLAFSCSEGLC